jgi:hypothetical protein
MLLKEQFPLPRVKPSAVTCSEAWEFNLVSPRHRILRLLTAYLPLMPVLNAKPPPPKHLSITDNRDGQSYADVVRIGRRRMDSGGSRESFNSGRGFGGRQLQGIAFCARQLQGPFGFSRPNSLTGGAQRWGQGDVPTGGFGLGAGPAAALGTTNIVQFGSGGNEGLINAQRPDNDRQ